MDVEKHIKRVLEKGKSLSDECLAEKLQESIKIGQPLYASLEIGDALMRENRYFPALAIIEGHVNNGDEHPLLDEFRAKVIWSMGQRKEALELLKERNEIWMRPYLEELQEIMERKA